jgi:hypothetical protein
MLHIKLLMIMIHITTCTYGLCHLLVSESIINSSSSVIAPPFSTAFSKGVLPALSTAPGFDPLQIDEQISNRTT